MWALFKAPAAADNQGRFWAEGSLPEVLLSPPLPHCPWDRHSRRPGHQALTLSGRAPGKPHPGCTYLVSPALGPSFPLCAVEIGGRGEGGGEWER